MKTLKRAKTIISYIALILINSFSGIYAQTQAPYGGIPWSIPGIIQAEDFDTGGEGIAYHDVTPINEGWNRETESVDTKHYDCGYDYSVGAVGWFKNGEWMEYTVNVDPGAYDISIRVGAAATGRKLKVYLNDSLITTFNIPRTGNVTKSETVDYYIFQTITVKNIVLPGGTNKILRLENVNNDFDIDWIDFVPAGTIKSQYPNNGVAAMIPGTIQAEDFDNGGEGVAYHDVSPTNEGGCEYRATESVDVRLVNYGDQFDRTSWVGKFKHGEWMEYTVDVDAGTYDISIMVGAEAAGKQLKVYLNDSLITTFDIPQTGGFTSWQTDTIKNIVLSGGTSKILKLENVNGDFNINWIKFERSGVIKNQAPYGGIPWPIPGTIEVEDFDTGGEGVAYHDITPNGGWWLRTDEGVDIMRKNDYDYYFFIGWFKHGEWMEYTVNVDPGAYDISINVAAITTGRQLKAYLNDSLIATFDIPNTGSYKKYQTYTAHNIVIPGGNGKILRLENVNNDFDLDWIKFEPVKTLPARTIPGIIQVEDFDLGGEGIAYHDVTPGNDISSYRASEGADIGFNCGSDIDPSMRIGFFKHGEWMKYTVDVDAGIYDISIRVAAVNPGKQLKAFLNDSLIATFDIPITGSYDIYQTYTIKNIVIPGGTAKILKLENVNNDFDFDWIRFENAGTLKTQAPYGGITRTIPGTIEAEDFDDGGEGIAYHDVTPINIGGCWNRIEESVDVYLSEDATFVGWFKHGEWMEYTVNVDSGMYNMSIRVAAEKNGRKLKAYLDDSLITVFDVPNTGSCDVYQTSTVNNIFLPGGTGKVLRLENVNNDFDLNWIQFEPAGVIKTQAPYGGISRKIPGIIQAEDFDTGGEGIAYHDVTPDSNEGGEKVRTEGVDIHVGDNLYVIGWFKNGEWMEYTVDVEPGTYDITARAAATEPGRKLKAYLDDSLIATFDILNTGSYNIWQSSTVKNIVLPGGTGKVLKLENVNNDFDLNWIKFEPAGIIKTQAPYWGITRTIPGTIQAEDFDTGGEGLAYHDVSPFNEGGDWSSRRDENVDIRPDNGEYFISWFKNGEWIEYTVNADPGIYDITIRVAAETTGKQLKAFLNDSLVAVFDIPNTGSINTYQTVTLNNIALSGGNGKILKLENVNNDFHIDWISFSKSSNSVAKIDEHEPDSFKGTKTAELKNGSIESNAELLISKAASLSQNVPNPFNGATEIAYFLPETVQNAVLHIYNMYGLRVKSIPVVNKGNGTITLNGAELQPGMYIYSLVADGQEIDTKRMMLIK